MSPITLTLLALGIFAIAFLYSSAGQAGGTAYIAVMSLFGLAPEVIRPTALSLNILVASLAAFQFWRAGHFSWRLFWPFALLATPCAFLGGYITLPARAFNVLIGLILLFSA
ncbi:MAG TPA: TSUP family transporter, partial [Longimicrobiales bacterium]|nr:TSUP family transporter [Longimicrobiales bacterium]